DPEKRTRFQSGLFYYIDGQKHIEPMANLLRDKFNVPAEEISRQVRASINRWLETYKEHALENEIDVENVHARSLASFTLANAQRPTHYSELDFYRVVPNHAF